MERENKANSKPIKANSKPIKANKMPKQTQFHTNLGRLKLESTSQMIKSFLNIVGPPCVIVGKTGFQQKATPQKTTPQKRKSPLNHQSKYHLAKSTGAIRENRPCIFSLSTLSCTQYNIRILLPEMPYNAVLHRTLCVISVVNDGSYYISTGSSTLSAPYSLSPSACSPGLKGSGSAN